MHKAMIVSVLYCAITSCFCATINEPPSSIFLSLRGDTDLTLDNAHYVFSALDSLLNSNNVLPVIVELPDTVHILARAWQITVPNDSRTPSVTLGSRSAQPPVLTSSVSLEGWKLQGDRTWVTRIPDKLGTLQSGMHLYWDDKPMPLAREPDDGTATSDSFWHLGLQMTGVSNAVKVSQEIMGLVAKPRQGTPCLVAFEKKDWGTAHFRIDSVDVQRGLLFLDRAADRIEWKRRFYICGTHPALDSPGEWYFDPATRTIVLRPPSDDTAPNGHVTASTSDCILSIRGALRKWPRIRKTCPSMPPSQASPTTRVTLNGIAFRCATGDGLRVTGGVNITVDSCKFEMTGRQAINVGGSQELQDVKKAELPDGYVEGIGGAGRELFVRGPCSNISIRNCDITNTGAEGIFAYGEDIEVVRNHIHDVGVDHKGCAAVFVVGRDITVRENAIHHGPRAGVLAKGCNLTIEDNALTDLMNETNDGGIIRLCQRSDRLGTTIIRENFIELSKGKNILMGLPIPTITWGVYLDDLTSNCLIEHNVFWGRASHGVYIHGGRRNTIRENCFVGVSGVLVSPYLGKCRAENTVVNNTFILPRRVAVYESRGCQDKAPVFDSNTIYLPTPKTQPVVRLNRRKVPWSQWRRMGQEAEARLIRPEEGTPWPGSIGRITKTPLNQESLDIINSIIHKSNGNPSHPWEKVLRKALMSKNE